MSTSRTPPPVPGVPPRVQTPASSRTPAPTGASQARFSDMLRQRRPGESDARAGHDDDSADHAHRPPAAEPEPPPPPEEPARKKEADGQPAFGILPTLRDPTTRAAEREKTKSRPDAPQEPAPAPAAVAPVSMRMEQPWSKIAREVGRSVVGFCNDPAVNNSEGWSVQMELRPDVVANTTLHLSLSPHWLTLRFDARDMHSHELLFNAQQDLTDILESSLSRKRDIAISFGST